MTDLVGRRVEVPGGRRGRVIGKSADGDLLYVRLVHRKRGRGSKEVVQVVQVQERDVCDVGREYRSKSTSNSFTVAQVEVLHALLSSYLRSQPIAVDVLVRKPAFSEVFTKVDRMRKRIKGRGTV